MRLSELELINIARAHADLLIAARLNWIDIAHVGQFVANMATIELREADAMGRALLGDADDASTHN